MATRAHGVARCSQALLEARVGGGPHEVAMPAWLGVGTPVERIDSSRSRASARRRARVAALARVRAPHLVDEVLADVPVSQWLLTPFTG